MPEEYRRVIHGVLPGSVRVSMWREHYMTFLSDDSPLSVEEKEFLQRAIELLPDIVGDDAKADRRAAFESEVMRVFSYEHAKPVFYRLGPPTRPSAAIDISDSANAEPVSDEELTKEHETGTSDTH